MYGSVFSFGSKARFGVASNVNVEAGVRRERVDAIKGADGGTCSFRGDLRVTLGLAVAGWVLAPLYCQPS